MHKTTSHKSETFQVKGAQIIDKVKSIVKEGNVRRIIIKDKDGQTVMEFPLTFGLVGAALAPILAAVGALAALLTECSIVVERKE